MSLAELNSRVFLGLGGPPPEVCELQDIHNAVVQALNVRAAFSRLSNTNVILSTTSDFVINSLQQTISIGKGVPVGVEMRLDGCRYYPIRIVNALEISKYSAYGLQNPINVNDLACAFYSNENGQHFIQFNYYPTNPIRIRYDADTVKTGMDNGSPLPDHVNELIVLEAQNKLIPRIKLKISQNMVRNEQERKDAQFILGTWDGVYAQNNADINPLETLWAVWSFRERRSESNVNRRTPRGRNLY